MEWWKQLRLKVVRHESHFCIFSSFATFSCKSQSHLSSLSLNSLFSRLELIMPLPLTHSVMRSHWGNVKMLCQMWSTMLFFALKIFTYYRKTKNISNLKYNLISEWLWLVFASVYTLSFSVFVLHGILKSLHIKVKVFLFCLFLIHTFSSEFHDWVMCIVFTSRKEIKEICSFSISMFLIKTNNHFHQQS